MEPESEMSDYAQRLMFVDNHHLMKSFAQQHRELLAEHIQLRYYKFDDRIYHQEQPSVNVYFILQGQVKIEMSQWNNDNNNETKINDEDSNDDKKSSSHDKDSGTKSKNSNIGSKSIKNSNSNKINTTVKNNNINNTNSSNLKKISSSNNNNNNISLNNSKDQNDSNIMDQNITKNPTQHDSTTHDDKTLRTTADLISCLSDRSVMAKRKLRWEMGYHASEKFHHSCTISIVGEFLPFSFHVTEEGHRALRAYTWI